MRNLKALGFVVVLIGLSAVVATAQQARAGEAPAKGYVAAGAWRVRVKQEGTFFLTVRAHEAPLNQIAAELSRQLKTPFVLSRVMQKQLVTLDFQDVPLESALQTMAPLPYVHYELRGNSTPICREIFLNAYNEPVPTPKLENKTVSFIMQGDTESNGDSKEDPLYVSYRNQRLSVKVKKQSLTAVLDRIAQQLGVNLSMNQDSNELVDLEIKEMSLEEAISYFPPTVHLHVRKDLHRLSVLPLLVEFVK
jgi:type II secretory pathway component GspD/PulD (secretin)